MSNKETFSRDTKVVFVERQALEMDIARMEYIIKLSNGTTLRLQETKND